MEMKERSQKVYLSWAFKIIECSWVVQVYFKKQQQSNELLKKENTQTWNNLVSSVTAENYCLELKVQELERAEG